MVLLRGFGATSLLVLLLSPAVVISQQYIKVALCTICSGIFVATGCPTNYDSLACRLVAFKLNVLNCRSYPCVDFDAPVQNQCVDIPFGCPIQHIKIYGLCSAGKMCCSNGNEEDASIASASVNQLKNWMDFTKLGGRSKRSLKHLLQLNMGDDSHAAPKLNQNSVDGAQMNATGTERDSGTDFDFGKFPTDIPMSMGDQFVPEIPENLNDPVAAERVIMSEYEKFEQELVAINEEAVAKGYPAIKMPSFEHFRAVVQGHKPIKE